jgi:hypothetical protein
VEAGGNVVAHGKQLQVAVLLFQAAKREVLSLPLSSSVSFFFLFFRLPVVCPFVLPFFFKFPPLFQASPCSFLPLSIFRFLSFYSLRPLSLSILFFFLPIVLALGGIYRAMGAGVSLLLPCHGAGLVG